MAGRDLIAHGQMGSGKSADFCLPIIHQILRRRKSSRKYMDLRLGCPLALILAPTREVSSQIRAEVSKFYKETGVKVVEVFGGAPMDSQFRNLETGVDILVATPFRLLEIIRRGKVSLRYVKFLVIDEADKMLNMEAMADVKKIIEDEIPQRVGLRQTMLFSATFPTEIQDLKEYFRPNHVLLTAEKVGSSTDHIRQHVLYVSEMEKIVKLEGILNPRKQVKLKKSL